MPLADGSEEGEEGGKMKEFEIPITRSAPKQAVKNPKVIDRMRRIAKKGPREFFGRKREKKRKKERNKERKKERKRRKEGRRRRCNGELPCPTCI